MLRAVILSSACISTVLALGSGRVHAADNFNCVPPYKAAHQIMPSPSANAKVDRFGSQTVCLQVLKSDVVNGTKCRRVTFTSPPDGFLCPTGSSCFGGGIFGSGFRKSVDANHDQVCMPFQNEVDLIQNITVSFFVNKPPHIDRASKSH
jgi:hypothetical protein